jgi:hypothetical protein
MNNDWELVVEDDSYISCEENGKIYSSQSEEYEVEKNDEDLANKILDLNDYQIINDIIPKNNDNISNNLSEIDPNINKITNDKDIIFDLIKTTYITNIIDDSKKTCINLVNTKKIIKKIPNSIWINLGCYILKHIDSPYGYWQIKLTYSIVSTVILCFRNKKYVYKISKYSITSVVPYLISFSKKKYH